MRLDTYQHRQSKFSWAWKYNHAFEGNSSGKTQAERLEAKRDVIVIVKHNKGDNNGR